MSTIKKFIFINAGTETRKALIAGIGDVPFEWYHSKNMMLHIDSLGIPHFIYRNAEIDFKDSYVFTRLRANDQQFCGIIYDYLKFHNIPASDPINHSYENSAEKISQMLPLALHGIKIPETIIFREESFKRNRAYIKEHLVYPLVYKTDGSKGKNVHVIHNEQELESYVLQKKPTVRALVQPFIENEFDTRTLVAFRVILGSIKRTRKSGYLNNVAQGAIPSRYTLTPEEENVAKRSAEICGIDFAGVDIIHTETGPLVIEVNKSPQVNGFESVHGYKVFTRIAKLITSKYF